MSVAGIDVQWRVGEETGPEAIQKLSFAFERAGDAMRELGRWVFPKLVPIFEAELTGQFDSEGRGPVAGSWAALSPEYEAWKNKSYPGQPILRATNRLYDALTSSSSPFALRTFSSDQFDFGTQGVEYASFHQTGTRRMPARPEYDFSPEAQEAIQRAAAAGIREAIKSGDHSNLLEVKDS